MKCFYIFIFSSTLFFSCTPDGQKMSAGQMDSLAKKNDSDEVDTFSVRKIDTLSPSEKKQNAADKKEADSIVKNASTILNQGDPDISQNVENAKGAVSDPDVAPSFPGGENAMENYIAKHEEYPLVAFQNEIKGTVKVKFVIESNGEISGVEVLQGLGYGCDESAMDLISRMPRWIPGKKSGVNVRCVVVLPISFGE